ncbi:hypothetical protein D3C73_1104060 [compost metagenome]
MKVDARVGLQRRGEAWPQRHRFTRPLCIGAHPIAFALDPQQAEVAAGGTQGVVAFVEDADLAAEQGHSVRNGQPHQTTANDHDISFLHELHCRPFDAENSIPAQAFRLDNLDRNDAKELTKA